MDTKSLTGKITFIHHEKDYATIDYEQNGKKKSINGNISEKNQLELKAKKIIKKLHEFRIGDEVGFIIVPSARGDKMVADCIEFRFNNAYDSLINKTVEENRFVGYLKKVADDYFVKETGSYILFPLLLSPWEIRPHESRLNEPVFFKLENIDKPGKATASLFRSEYIAEYGKAVECYKKKAILTAKVYKISPHGIFVEVMGNKIVAKISPQKIKENILATMQVGSSITIIITFINHLKIVVEPAD
jgi:hypothetical protein